MYRLNAKQLGSVVLGLLALFLIAVIARL